jgi:hypothetical protein
VGRAALVAARLRCFSLRDGHEPSECTHCGAVIPGEACLAPTPTNRCSDE